MCGHLCLPSLRLAALPWPSRLPRRLGPPLNAASCVANPAWPGGMGGELTCIATMFVIMFDIRFDSRPGLVAWSHVAVTCLPQVQGTESVVNWPQWAFRCSHRAESCFFFFFFFLCVS